MMRPESGKAESIRVGWFDVFEGTAKKMAPRSRYDAALIGPKTIVAAAPSWKDAMECSPQILNVGYDLEDGSTTRSDRTIVSWNDALTVSEAARCLIDARKVMSRLLELASGDSAVLIDAAAVSKSLLASLLGLLVRTRACSSIDILYSKKEYSYQGQPLDTVYAAGPLHHGINDIEFHFSAIPYVEGKYKSGRKRHCIVLCGLDFQRVLAKVSELEPASVDIIIEKEALSDHANLTVFERMCSNLGIHEEQAATIERARVRPVIELLKSLIGKANSRGLHPIVIAAGGKPFTVAGVLQSVLDSEAPMLATIPDRVVDLSSLVIGDQLVYRLTDRTALI